MIKKLIYTLLFISITLLASGYDNIETKYSESVFTAAKSQPVNPSFWNYPTR